MMREMLTRRFQRALKEDPERSGESWPDLVLLDGGQGQLTVGSEVLADLGLGDLPFAAIAKGPDRDAGRSEEHTSELQSLMRISYAVFCLKKKKKNNTQQSTNNSVQHQTTLYTLTNTNNATTHEP